jgi:hypothetical protein
MSASAGAAAIRRKVEEKLNALPQFMTEIDGEAIFLMIDTNSISTTHPVDRTSHQRRLGALYRMHLLGLEMPLA